MLTKHKDVDFQILMQLNDTDLAAVCQANQYVRSLCNNDVFWRNRLIAFIQTTLTNEDIINLVEIKTFLEFNTWKEFYVWIKESIIKYDRLAEEHHRARNFNNKNVLEALMSKDISIGERKKMITNTLNIMIKYVKLPDWINIDKFKLKLKREMYLNAAPGFNQYLIHDDYEPDQEMLSKTFGVLNNIDLANIEMPTILLLGEFGYGDVLSGLNEAYLKRYGLDKVKL